jgi:hypothetical protein
VLWIGGGQGAGKTTLSWQLSRASDLPLHDDIAARDLGKVPVIVEGPQLMPGFAAQLPPGWCVWLLREGAVLAGRPVIEVPPYPDWPVIAAAIESALAPALGFAPRMAPGSELSRQRRYENLWLEDSNGSVTKFRKKLR